MKRAYADWSRYRDARHELMNAGLGLIEMPSAREGAKNRADIQMAVDAMELAYSREHVDAFVIVSGDSDFTPLVGKLRELNKRVIGVGNRESASELLIANCDEFIFYDRLAAERPAAPPRAGRRAAALNLNPVQLLQETLTALQREGVEWPLASIVKDSMRRKYPAFDESEHGFSTFSKFLEEAGGTGMVRLETDPRSGTYRVELAEGRTVGDPADADGRRRGAPERGADEGEGGRRRRRRGGRRSEQAGTPEARAERLAPGAEVFEVVVTPTPDLDLGTLPPLDEPISYEDMIMLGPEVDAELPDLVEATDVAPASRRRAARAAAAAAAPAPTRSRRSRTSSRSRPPRRRFEAAGRGGAVAEAEAEAPAEEEAAGRRPRRRRRAGTSGRAERRVTRRRRAGPPPRSRSPAGAAASRPTRRPRRPPPAAACAAARRPPPSAEAERRGAVAEPGRGPGRGGGPGAEAAAPARRPRPPPRRPWRPRPRPSRGPGRGGAQAAPPHPPRPPRPRGGRPPRPRPRRRPRSRSGAPAQEGRAGRRRGARRRGRDGSEEAPTPKRRVRRKAAEPAEAAAGLGSTGRP